MSLKMSMECQLICQSMVNQGQGINRHSTVDVLSTNDPGYKWFQPRFLNAESNALTIKPYTSHLSVQLYGFLIRFQCYESD